MRVRLSADTSHVRLKEDSAFGTELVVWLLPAMLCAASAGCVERPTSNPNVIVASMTSGPATLDPRSGTDDFSAKTQQLIFTGLVDLDEHLRVVPTGAERLDNPTPTTYVAILRRGVRFHDGHELTSADVVHTFRSLLAPDFISAKKGALRTLKSVDAIDRYTVQFTLTKPFSSFPVNLVGIGIVPAGAGTEVGEHPVGTGPYRFTRYLVDDRIELQAFADYYEGAPKNDGVVLKIVPDDVMRGLELRQGAMDIVVNDLAPDIVHQLKEDDRLTTVEAPGVDYQYIGLNLRDPVLSDLRVRQALASAIDQRAIIDYLRRGLATPAVGLVPPLSWAFNADVPVFSYDPDRARRLLDEAGYRDPDGDGPAPRLRLTLKVSNIEFNRLQSAVIQQNLQRVGVDVEVRMYEFATLYADVLSGNFQMFTLQWAGGALADPDILRRVFHSSEVPPAGFNRGHYKNARVDALLDEASASLDDDRRRELYGEVQRIIAADVPYVSLWYKTNFAIARRSLTGVHLSPTADFFFLKDVSRLAQPAAN